MTRWPLALALLLAACDHGPRVGDPCSAFLSGGCATDHSELRCDDDHYIEVPCRGSGGCSVGESNGMTAPVTCDLSGNLDGDRCARPSSAGSGLVIRMGGQEDASACTPDHRAIVICHDGAFHRVRCDGPRGCSEAGTSVHCDTLAPSP